MDTLTVYERLLQTDTPWCRYCGTTEDAHWRPGPWGSKTLCNRHGCDYRGYGSSIKRQRLDLGSYEGEGRNQRKRPIVQEVCCVCGAGEPDNKGHPIVMCHGCPWAFHLQCRTPNISTDEVSSGTLWFCTPTCAENHRTNSIVTQCYGRVIPHHSNSEKFAQQEPAAGRTRGGRSVSGVKREAQLSSSSSSSSLTGKRAIRRRSPKQEGYDSMRSHSMSELDLDSSMNHDEEGDSGQGGDDFDLDSASDEDDAGVIVPDTVALAVCAPPPFLLDVAPMNCYIQRPDLSRLPQPSWRVISLNGGSSSSAGASTYSDEGVYMQEDNSDDESYAERHVQLEDMERSIWATQGRALGTSSTLSRTANYWS